MEKTLPFTSDLLKFKEWKQNRFKQFVKLNEYCVERIFDKKVFVLYECMPFKKGIYKSEVYFRVISFDKDYIHVDFAISDIHGMLRSGTCEIDDIILNYRNKFEVAGIKGL